MKIGRKLKPGELEIVWLAGSAIEIVQTNGVTYSAAGIVLAIGDSHVIIPLAAVKRFRVAKAA